MAEESGVKLTLEEQELSILVNGSDRNVAEVYTDDPVWQGRLEKWYQPYSIKGPGRFYRIKTSEIVRVARLTRGPLDDEAKAALRNVFSHEEDEDAE